MWCRCLANVLLIAQVKGAESLAISAKKYAAKICGATQASGRGVADVDQKGLSYKIIEILINFIQNLSKIYMNFSFSTLFN